MRVEYVRDGLVEEFHDGICVSLDDTNPPCEPYYLRSCAKPLQASLLIDYGIELSPDELALCCGSHAGEECHIETAYKILKKFDIDESFLKCGVHAPLSRTMQDKMLLKGESAKTIHNNCSGKHIGFLIICKKMGWDLDNYFEPEHPLQLAVKRKIYELCEILEPELYPVTTDGCGVPIVSMPLWNLVVGYKNLMKYPQIIDAILKYPYIYGGEDRLDTEIIQKTEGVIAKVGAGGLCVVFNTVLNDGFVVKMFDASMLARRFAVIDCINRLGWGNIDADWAIKTISGKVVGQIRVV